MLRQFLIATTTLASGNMATKIRTQVTNLNLRLHRIQCPLYSQLDGCVVEHFVSPSDTLSEKQKSKQNASKKESKTPANVNLT